ncbi:ABC transporter protein [Halomicronema hongdechloris C2206]|uniref:ABC transporter protein n=1 Tax=Halomicronema hongdechloris C2206 TaxID=1641165 RepID=A0A1Z3HMY0_9CYAN|nr:ATP-binding cassette domain-containing protein [Halomicronema hongdechloris]ASC71636.1 ABC transporter protein [Halomicronema hongdechloris C2206]
MFELSHVRVAYPGQERWAVDGVSLTLAAGEKLGLVGESGCGKSTLGRAALRLLPPQSQVQGEVWFNGEAVLEFTPQRLRQFRGEAIALVFQDPMTRLDPLIDHWGSLLGDPAGPSCQSIRRGGQTTGASGVGGG